MTKPYSTPSRDVLSRRVQDLVGLADRYLTQASDYHRAITQGKPTDTKPNEVKLRFAQGIGGHLEVILAMKLPSNVLTAVKGLQTFLGYSTSDKCDWETQTVFDLIADTYHDKIREELLCSIRAQQPMTPDRARSASDRDEGGGGIGTLER